MEQLFRASHLNQKTEILSWVGTKKAEKIKFAHPNPSPGCTGRQQRGAAQRCLRGGGGEGHKRPQKFQRISCSTSGRLAGAQLGVTRAQRSIQGRWGSSGQCVSKPWALEAQPRAGDTLSLTRELPVSLWEPRKLECWKCPCSLQEGWKLMVFLVLSHPNHPGIQ